jgi:hypothetical protein
MMTWLLAYCGVCWLIGAIAMLSGDDTILEESLRKKVSNYLPR